jgi:hypothetical protein
MQPSAAKLNAVTSSMNNNFFTEILRAIADALRKTATQQGETSQDATAPSSALPKPNQPMRGVLLFVADLLSNSALARLVGSSRPETAMLRGSLEGLASGVEAVSNADSTDEATVKSRPLRAIVTVSAYVFGGIAVALILRALRGWSRTTTIPTET